MDAIKEKQFVELLNELEDDVRRHQAQLQDSKQLLNEEITLLKEAVESQKKIIQSLESERQLLKSALMSIPASIVIADSKTKQVIFTNKHATKFHSCNPKHINAIRSYHPNKAYRNNGRLYKAGDWPIMRALRHNKTVDNEEVKCLLNGGSTRYLQISASPIHNERGKKIAAIEVCNDITKRKEAELRQRESEQMHKNVFDSAWHGIVILTPQGQFIDCNPAFAGLLGYTRKELFRLSARHIVPNDCQELLLQFRDQILANKQITAEITAIRKDGRTIPIEVGAGATFTYHGHPALLAFTRDLTETKQVEQQLRQHQLQLAHAARMNTLGELTAGIAHELNQPLGAIVNYTKGCIRRLNSQSPDPTTLIPAISEVSKQAERAGEIILRLRRFAKKGELKQTITDPNEVVRESISFLQPEISSHGITIRKKLARQIPPVFADKIQLEQVVVNIIKNAVDALTEAPSEGRRIYLQTSLTNEQAIEILIHDFGPGFNDQELNKIFQPFYTTKNDGLGVGLSISQTIIEAHGGNLKATPQPKEGACFRITLPAANTQQGVEK